ncbi:hypothetical protein ACG33_00790 [Steroidobacter denitrificans]|uniref:Molybdate ABC transporter substrate-binding protein n=1 Tax=Steroidobacter denitrificans TaxID=465721 RepID=A0A127F5E1_STEDE|nr:molybdate ABC transporter substrate-binding protein [Steroidobacter denitrificans]AMN45664.1 hypothetical protein ACG33_00790 [Steroidobacter denitrificans]
MSIRRRYLIACVATAWVTASGAASGAASRPPEPLVVFAAASLTDVLQEIGERYTQTSGTPVRLSFAASSVLARQIESGARAQVYFSADQDWMDYLQAHDLIDRGSRQNLLGNRLVLIAPSDSKTSFRLAEIKKDRGKTIRTALLEALGPAGRLSIADPDSVPAGKYAMSALETLNLWDIVESRQIRADNVRMALMYVARGETPLGIVYSTDASAEPRVRIVDFFPSSSHEPITYPIAATHDAGRQARPFLEFLRGEAARTIFFRAGFIIIEPPGERTDQPARNIP